MKKIFLGLLFVLLSQSVHARYFDPEGGRFINRDPLEYVDGMSLYAGYFAQRFTVDPSGTVIKKEIEHNDYDSNFENEKKIKITVHLSDDCKDKVEAVLDVIKLTQKSAMRGKNHPTKHRSDTKWFGAVTKKEQEGIQKVYEDTYKSLIHKHLFIHCEPCPKGDTAGRVERGVGKGVGIVTLYPRFFELGMKVKIKAFFHEYTHISSATHDNGYRTNDPNVYIDPSTGKATKKLTKEEKLKNADTYSASLEVILQ